MNLAADEGFPHADYIDYLANQVDPETGTLQARGVFENPKRQIISGLFANVRLPLAQIKDALLVPESALGQDQHGRFLMVVKPDNSVEPRVVTQGARYHNLRVIQKGLEPTDRVVILGLQRARPGAKVTPKEGRIEPPPPK